MVKDNLDEALDLHNYATWRIRFEALCEERGLGHALLAAPVTGADQADSVKVKTMLIKNVKDHLLTTVTNAPNAKMAWDALASIFAANSNARRLALRKELSRLQMADGEPVPMYVARARQLHADLLGVGIAISESDLACSVLIGLPERFKIFKTFMMTYNGELNLEFVQAQLQDYETWHGVSNYASKSVAFSATTSYGQQSQWGSGRGFAERRGPVICYNCGKPGHIARVCTKQKKCGWSEHHSQISNNGYQGGWIQGGRPEVTSNSNDSSKSVPRTLTFAAASNQRNDGWYMDSGSVHHVTNDPSELINVRPLCAKERIEIVGVGGQVLRPTAIGCLIISSNVIDNLTICFTNVYVVEDSIVKILSVRRLDDQNAHVLFGDGMVRILDNNEVVLTGQRQGDLYAITYRVPGKHTFGSGGKDSLLRYDHGVSGASRAMENHDEIDKAGVQSQKYLSSIELGANKQSGRGAVLHIGQRSSQEVTKAQICTNLGFDESEMEWWLKDSVSQCGTDSGLHVHRCSSKKDARVQSCCSDLESDEFLIGRWPMAVDSDIEIDTDWDEEDNSVNTSGEEPLPSAGGGAPEGMTGVGSPPQSGEGTPVSSNAWVGKGDGGSNGANGADGAGEDVEMPMRSKRQIIGDEEVDRSMSTTVHPEHLDVLHSTSKWKNMGMVKKRPSMMARVVRTIRIVVDAVAKALEEIELVWFPEEME